MMCEQLDAILTLKRAAIGLSEACLDYMRVPNEAVPLTAFYDRTMLHQPLDISLSVLLGKLG